MSSMTLKQDSLGNSLAQGINTSLIHTGHLTVNRLIPCLLLEKSTWKDNVMIAISIRKTSQIPKWNITQPPKPVTPVVGEALFLFRLLHTCSINRDSPLSFVHLEPQSAAPAAAAIRRGSAGGLRNLPFGTDENAAATPQRAAKHRRVKERTTPSSVLILVHSHF